MRLLFPILCVLGCSDKTLQVVNTAPSVSIVSPTDGSEFQEYESIEFYALVNDAQQSPETLALSWVSDLDGVISEESADSNGDAIMITASLSPGNHIVRLNVIDNKAESGVAYVEISVIDTEDDPTLSVRHPQPDEFGVEGEDTYFEVVVSDIQDAPDTLFVTIDSDVDGALCSDNADETGLFICESPVSIGAHNLAFAVTDSNDNTILENLTYSVLPLTEIDDDGDGFTEVEGDCDDTDSSVYPDAAEFPNQVDDDCDTIIDEGTTSYDDDGDCFCESEPCVGSVEVMCIAYAVGDCDDSNPGVSPDAEEVCDSIDNNCDSQIDENTPCVDDDGDGYTELDGDCDDTTPLTFPGAPETADAQDNDCDTTIDEGTENFDDDGDCYCEASNCQGSISTNCASVMGDDCDDDDDNINPGILETCDGLDNNCDGVTDEDTAIDAQTWHADGDSDGFGDSATLQVACYQPTGFVSNATDCNDANAAINPASQEVCNGIDDNCTNGVDEGVTTTYYADADGDGYGGSSSQQACSTPSGYVGNNDDCNDSNGSINPAQIEVCDNIDNDCDGDTDDSDNSLDLNSAPYWYADGDNDGHGNPNVSLRQCSQPSGYVSVNTDCNDSSGSAYPGAIESCDGIDNNCDNTVDEANANGCNIFYMDGDGDGYGTPNSSQCLCNPSGAFDVTNNDDCYDNNGDARPGQSAWFSVDRGDGSFDYDCNGSQAKRYNGSGSCGGWPGCSTNNGWNSSNPACGNTAKWVDGCSTDWFSCDKNTSNKTQECR